MKPKVEKHKRPGQVGGTLIRKVIQLLKNSGISYPFSKPVVLAFSGGTDSLALAALLSRYGKKVIGDPQNLTLLYLEHSWKSASETKKSQKKLQKLAKELGVPLELVVLKPRSQYPTGESPEAVARELRKEIFKKKVEAGAIVLTAHHADDLAETLVWRFFTGTLKNHPQGILFWNEGVLRPLLTTRKEELVSFLKEEKLQSLKDPANDELNYLRVKMRKTLIKPIEEIFPRAVENLMKDAVALQLKHPIQNSVRKNSAQTVGHLSKVLGIQLRKQHYDSIQIMISKSIGQLSLPGGWTLSWKQDTEELKLSRLK